MAFALADVPAFPSHSGSARFRAAFETPRRWLVARELAEVAAVLDAAHDAARAGAWCIGWVAYEAASALDPAYQPGQHVHPAPEGKVLAAFAVFGEAGPWPAELPLAGWHAEAWHDDMLAAVGQAATARFAEQVESIRSRIARGDVYQVNLTTRLGSVLEGDPLAYFGALHRSQPAGYSFYIAHALEGEEARVLSVSPELFFHWHGGTVTAQPMKGTAPRGATPASDAASAANLRASPKERAENLMIVDLLRNDLSRIATLGSVRVPNLFELHALPTVWQMTSTVQATTRASMRLSDVFRALFPCGSVTGAPKRMAMACIRELEPAPRGVYCGAVGLLRPGGEALFNVPIRTVTLRAQTAAGEPRWRATCGVGSGITYDSRPDDEAREWHHKQAFLRRAAAPFELLETLRLEDGEYWLLEGHLARLARAAAHFGFVHDPVRIERALGLCAEAHETGLYRVRLLVNAAGTPSTEARPLAPTPVPVKLAWARASMPSADEFVAYKTTRRDAYAPFATHSEGTEAAFDTVLWNAKDQITETTFGNIALRIGGRWLTPAAGAGLLPGVYREQLLAEGRITEAELRTGDMGRAEGAAFFNSVRGWLEVDWPDLRDRWQHFVGQRGQV